MSDRLVLLGTKGGPAIRPAGPSPTASLLHMCGRRIVIDCGLGVTRGLVETGMQLKDLDLILVTHLHSDHVLELGPLVHTAWTSGLSSPVTIVGPAGLGHYWHSFLQSMAFDIDIRIGDEGRPDLRELVSVEEASEGPWLQDGALTVSALRVDHPPVAHCYALRLEGAGHRIVFSADTAFFPPLADFAMDADILVHEAMLEEGVERLVARTGNGTRLKQHLMASHTLAVEAGRIASLARVGHLVLHHLIPADDAMIDDQHWFRAVRQAWDGPLTLGRDGLVVPLDGRSP